MNELVKIDNAIEKVLIQGDLASLSMNERISYYNSVCKSLGINPLTKPFEYIKLNNKLTLYSTKNATDQLRNVYHISITIASAEMKGDVYIVIARATDPTGRADEDIGVVYTKGLAGDMFSNAIMKAYTKAKRRVTLSICGLSVLDESEVDSVKGAVRVDVDMNTGEIKELPQEKQVNTQPQAKPFRPMTLEKIIASIEKYKSTFEGKLLNKNQLTLFNIILNKLVDDNDSKRKEIIKFLFDIDTSNNATKGMLDYVIKWTEYKDKNWLPADYVIDEAQLILDYMLKEHLLNDINEVA